MEQDFSSPVPVARSHSRAPDSKNQQAQGVLDFADRDRRNANTSRWQAREQVSPPLFDGQTYNKQHDEIRLSGQMGAVFACMSDGRWRTLQEIRAFIKSGSEAGISARLRDCRKEKWGGSVVNRRRRGNGEDGVHEYQLVTNSTRIIKLIGAEVRS